MIISEQIVRKLIDAGKLDDKIGPSSIVFVRTDHHGRGNRGTLRE